MLTFKKFLEADVTDLGTVDAPQAPMAGAAPAEPQQTGKQMKGSLTDNQKRVLALLSHNALKTAPQRAREIIAGDQNMVQAVKGLKANFNAVDVSPDGVVINQAGIELANTAGIVDPNSGELTDLGQKLVTTTSQGTPNPKTKDLAGAPAGGMGGGMPGGDMGMGGMPPMESMKMLKSLL